MRPPRRSTQIPCARPAPQHFGELSAGLRCDSRRQSSVHRSATFRYPHPGAEPLSPRRGQSSATGTAQTCRRRVRRPPGAARAAEPAPVPRPLPLRGGAGVPANGGPPIRPIAAGADPRPAPGEEARTPGAWLPGASLTKLGSRPQPRVQRAVPTTGVRRGARTPKHACIPARCLPGTPPPRMEGGGAALRAGRNGRSRRAGRSGLWGAGSWRAFPPAAGADPLPVVSVRPGPRGALKRRA